MAKASRDKTAFVTPFGQFQFSVMPFGLKGAPATFQRMMDKLVGDMEGFAASYMDDIVIYSASWDEHLTHIQQVLECLGLTAKPSKCKFGMAECNYLGHVVGRGIVRPDPTKLEAVDSFPIPKTKQQLRRFLDLTGYYRRFIQGYALIASPLTDLTRKTEPQQL